MNLKLIPCLTSLAAALIGFSAVTLTLKGQQDGNNPLPLKIENSWPELKRGANGLVPRFTVPKPNQVSISDPKHTIAGVFVLKFVEGSHVRLSGGSFVFPQERVTVANDELNRLARAGLKPDEVRPQLDQINAILQSFNKSHGFELTPMFGGPQSPQSEASFIEKAELEQRAAEELADLDLYYVVYAPAFKDASLEEALMNQLNQFRVVETVYPAVIAEPAQGSSAPTPDIDWQQGHLNEAPAGLNVRAAWSRPGSRGDGVRLIDVEYDWVTDHEDFPRAANRFWGGRPSCAYDYLSTEHGTAVMGTIAAPQNGLGVVGIASNVTYGLSSVCRPFDYGWAAAVASFSGENWVGRAHNVVVANAISDAAGQLRAGDVILIEQHVPGPSTGMPCNNGNCGQWEFVAMEFYQESFDVIRRASARGLVVVEAAGNGGQDLDASIYLNRFNPAIRSSQAILIGASGAGDRLPAMFTNSGRRVDLFAWGGGVVTLGYRIGGVPPFTNNPISRYYTNNFGGTSSASALVAGAVASYQGNRLARGTLPFVAADVRNVLFATGTPQVPGSTARSIGRQPNLAVAMGSVSAGGFTGPGLYTIESKWSRKVLDIDIAFFRGQDDRQPCQQWDSHGGTNQQFRITDAGGGNYVIQAVHSNKVLDVADWSTSSGGPIVQYPFHGGNNQQFRIEAVGDYARIVSRHSNKAIEVRDWSRGNGARIQQWDWHGGDNQLFRFIRLAR